MGWLLPFMCSWNLCEAQLQSLVISSTTQGSGAVSFNNYAALGEKGGEKLDYSEVYGTCYWEREWRPALLIQKSGSSVKIKKVKINFYTNDIHYIDGHGTELVAQYGIIHKLIFFDQLDSTKVAAVFQYFFKPDLKQDDCLMQVLNTGKTQLLKKTVATLVKKNYDPYVGKPEFKFVTEVDYGLLQNGEIRFLKSLGKEDLFNILKPSHDDEGWLKSNKNRLKKEAEVIAFLSIYNSQER